MSIIGTIKNLMRWCVLTAPSADNKDFPLHQITYVGKNADCLAWYPYGYHANPGAGFLALMLAVNADPENRVMFPGSPKERLDGLLPTPLAEDELLIFNPLTKSHIHFKADGTIDIVSQKDVNIRVVGNMLADVEGDLIADVEGKITETAEDDTTKTVTGGDDTVVADTIQRTANTEFNVGAPKIIIGDGASDDILLVISDLLVHLQSLHAGPGAPPLAALQVRADDMRS